MFLKLNNHMRKKGVEHALHRSSKKYKDRHGNVTQKKYAICNQNDKHRGDYDDKTTSTMKRHTKINCNCTSSATFVFHHNTKEVEVSNIDNIHFGHTTNK